MAKKALDRKSFAENPHARFDKGAGESTKPKCACRSGSSSVGVCGCLLVILILGMVKSAGISWWTHGKYGWTFGKSFMVLSAIAAGIILLVAVCVGTASIIDWLKMKRAKQRDMPVKVDADATDEMQNRIDRKEEGGK